MSRASEGFRALQQIVPDRDGDDYGWAMSWLFAICDTLTFLRETPPKSEWQFRPSPMGYGSGDDYYKEEILAEFTDEQLLYVGEVLHRYIAHLKKLGKDY